MPIVIAATYVAKEGAAEQLREILELVTPLARGESGCITYQAHRSVEDPNVFFLYEQYVDEAAAKAHTVSEHFDRHIRNGAWPLLASRVVVRAEPLP